MNLGRPRQKARTISDIPSSESHFWESEELLILRLTSFVMCICWKMESRRFCKRRGTTVMCLMEGHARSIRFLKRERQPTTTNNQQPSRAQPHPSAFSHLIVTSPRYQRLSRGYAGMRDWSKRCGVHLPSISISIYISTLKTYTSSAFRSHSNATIKLNDLDIRKTRSGHWKDNCYE